MAGARADESMCGDRATGEFDLVRTGRVGFRPVSGRAQERLVIAAAAVSFVGHDE